MTDRRRIRLQERIEAALRDIRELEADVAAGEVEPAVAALLRDRYEAEAAEAMRELDDARVEAPAGRSGRRILIGTSIFLAMGTLAIITVVNAVQPRDGGAASGAAADVETSIDPETVTNADLEQVVAANPDVFPMRLALARRYVEDGEFSAALDHYLYILEREDNAEALMYVGWMTYASGEAETGVALLRRSLELAPDEPLAQWFLANALFYGTGATQEAVPLLQTLVETPSIPAEIRAEATTMLEEAGQ